MAHFRVYRSKSRGSILDLTSCLKVAPHAAWASHGKLVAAPVSVLITGTSGIKCTLPL